MKKRIFVLAAVIGVAALYYFSLSAYVCGEKKPEGVNAGKVQSSSRDTFINCIFNTSFRETNDEWHLGDLLHIARNQNKYKELNFNAVQVYDEVGSQVYGKVDNELSDDQVNRYKHFLDSVRAYTGLKGFFERSFISKYCYGQRLIYEVPASSNDMSTNYGFVYRHSERGTKETDSGRTVIHAVPGSQSAGYLCRDIYENLQQSDLLDFRQNDKGTWYIKPVMRIPTGIPVNKKVIGIEITRFDGTPVDTIIIKTDDFKNRSGIYSGNYLDKYTFPVGTKLEVSGDGNLPTSLNYRKTDSWWMWDDSCKVDFRVFWYGECEVWFDKMILDDETANDLFDTDKQPEINLRIQKEVTNFTNYGSLYSFFIDEVTVSQIPCLQYVMRKMTDYNPSSRLSFALTNYLHVHGLKNDNLSYQMYFDALQPKIIQADHHGFYTDNNNNGIKIPNVFRAVDRDPRLNPAWFISPNDYNNILQNKIIGSKIEKAVQNSAGSLIYEINKTKTDIDRYSNSAMFIMQPQIHGYLYADTNTGIYVNGVREPTNEEIQLQAMVSLAHGADGLCWFIYNSHIWKTKSQKPTAFMMGLVDPENSISNRVKNSYGQNKWQYVSKMNGKMLKWATVLNSIKWDDGFSVHNEGAGHYYINNIKSLYETNSGGTSQCFDGNTMSDCSSESYWEEGFFNPTNSSDRNKYFMMVNRRCIPKVEGTYSGDLRILKIQFKASDLPGFTIWKLINAENDSLITTFDKNTNAFVDAGVFQPGEGKLFKLVPVMGEGGMLEGSEKASDGMTFNFSGMGFNTGKYIAFNAGTGVNFLRNSGNKISGRFFDSGVSALNEELIYYMRSRDF